MATVLKTVIGASLSRVQIPAPPPSARGQSSSLRGRKSPRIPCVDVLLDLDCDVSPLTFGPARVRIYWWFFGRWMVVMGLLVIVGALDLRALGVPDDLWGLALWVGIGILFISVLLTVAVRFGRTRTSLNQGHFHFVARQD